MQLSASAQGMPKSPSALLGPFPWLVSRLNSMCRIFCLHLIQQANMWQILLFPGTCKLASLALRVPLLPHPCPFTYLYTPIKKSCTV